MWKTCKFAYITHIITKTRHKHTLTRVIFTFSAFSLYIYSFFKVLLCSNSDCFQVYVGECSSYVSVCMCMCDFVHSLERNFLNALYMHKEQHEYENSI